MKRDYRKSLAMLWCGSGFLCLIVTGRMMDVLWLFGGRSGGVDLLVTLRLGYPCDEAVVWWIFPGWRGERS